MLDLQQKVTSEIVEALKKGVKPWACPWEKSGISALPINLATGAFYTGINILLLWFKASENRYSSNTWLTFNQAKKLNGAVMKGEKGTAGVFYKLTEVEDKETQELKSVPIMKQFVVFNLDQIDGIKYGQSISDNTFEPVEKGEQLLVASGAAIKYGTAGAYYRPSSDRIFLPHKEAFRAPEDFYSTALHELVHWTGHQERLNRTKGKAFGDEEYAFEELVAELGSAFLCAEVGLKGELQHASYIDYWLKILQKDNRAIFRAASLASKAQQYIMAFGSLKDELKVA